jgi:nitrogen fixation/metabolism regulation signal transduction histidine kinase
MKQPRQPRGFRWIAVGQVILWAAIGGGAFLLLAKSVQNSSEFGRLQLWILGIDVCGVIVLSVLLAQKVWRLVRDYRAHVPGSRLTARTVGIFGALVIAPLLIVYMSSLEFINRGIDSWFTVEVKQGLNDALDLSQPRAGDLAVRAARPHPGRQPRERLREPARATPD